MRSYQDKLFYVIIKTIFFLRAENIRRKNKHLRLFIFPGLKGQSRLTTGLLKKSHAIPLTFSRYLGQKQTAVPPLNDVNAVTADFNFLNILNLFQGRKY